MEAQNPSVSNENSNLHFLYEIPTEKQNDYDGISFGKSWKKNNPEEPVTIFWADKSSTLKMQAEKLESTRHPNILNCLDSVEREGKFYMVTEQCKPLELYWKEAELDIIQEKLMSSFGILRILDALKFLHEEEKLSHENIRKGIFVTTGGDWKVAALHLVTPFSSPQTDLNQLAIVLWEIFNGFDESISLPQAPRGIPSLAREFYHKIGDQSGEMKGVAEIIEESRLNNGFLKNRYIEFLLRLETFKFDEYMNGDLFAAISHDLRYYSDHVKKHKVLPRLVQIHRNEGGHACPTLLEVIFDFEHLLNDEEYQRIIVPCLLIPEPIDFEGIMQVAKGFSDEKPLNPRYKNRCLSDFSRKIREAVILAMKEFYLKHFNVLITLEYALSDMFFAISEGLNEADEEKLTDIWWKSNGLTDHDPDYRPQIQEKEDREEFMETIKLIPTIMDSADLEVVKTNWSQLERSFRSIKEETFKISEKSYNVNTIAK